MSPVSFPIRIKTAYKFINRIFDCASLYCLMNGFLESRRATILVQYLRRIRCNVFGRFQIWYWYSLNARDTPQGFCGTPIRNYWSIIYYYVYGEIVGLMIPTWEYLSIFGYTPKYIKIRILYNTNIYTLHYITNNFTSNIYPGKWAYALMLWDR